MKVFMITWGLFCFLVIVGLFIAYATDNFPGVPAPQAEYAQGESLTEDECSPCEENLKRLKKAMQKAAHEQTDAVKAENLVRVKKALEQSQKTAETFHHEQTDDNLEQFKKTLETFDRELSALESEKNKAAKEVGQPSDDSP